MTGQANKQQYLGEYEYVMMIKDTCDQNLLPDEFDKWTVNEQCDWINKNLRTFYPHVPESLLEFIPAFFHQGNYDRSPTNVPEWFDIEKYRKGQKFVKNYFGSILINMVLSILYLYSFEDVLKGFIMGGHLHSPYMAFKRYLSTIHRIIKWFKGEPWVENTTAYKDMQIARKLHSAIRNKVCRLNNDEIDAMCTFANPWCTERELLLKDFTIMCPFEKIDQRSYKFFAESSHRPKSLNSANMAQTQCCFISLILLYPEKMGVHNIVDDDLEAFCHLWRCYGYFLGIEEEYNFCRGSLEEIKQRTRDLFQYWIIPNFKNITPEWEHMTRCIIEPFNYLDLMYAPYKLMILFSIEIFDINMVNLHVSLSYFEWIVYKIGRFIFRYVFKLSIIRSSFNKLVMKMLDEAAHFSPQKHAQLHEKSKEKVREFVIAS